MIKQIFINGTRIREILIDKKVVSMHDKGTGIPPIIIDLTKIEKDKRFEKLNKEQKKFLRAIKKLNTEEEIAKDIKLDFQKTGWRLIKDNEK